VLVPALRTVGNIVTGDDMQTQVIISCGALTCLLHLLKTAQKKSIKKEACWTISNITAGTKDQIQAVIDAGASPITSSCQESLDPPAALTLHKLPDWAQRSVCLLLCWGMLCAAHVPVDVGVEACRRAHACL
jgi:hypothetical protein